MKELLFIAYAGMIRGAVAFGLVLRLNPAIPNRSVIITSSLVLVIGTTIFMGSTVATLQRILFGDLTKKQGGESHEVHGDHNESHHEMFMHPNYDASPNVSAAPDAI
jgi:hypothetical protein